MLNLFWKLFLTLWLSIVGFSAAIGYVNDRLAREQWAEDPANTFSRGVYRIGHRLRVTLREEGPSAARDELLSVPRMTRGHIYLTDAGNQEILERDEDLTVLLRRRGAMKTYEAEDPAGEPWTLFTVTRAPPAMWLAPGPAGTALRLLAATLLSALVSWFLARSLTAPVGVLRTATRSIAAGNLDTRVRETMPERHDEFGQLAEDFDNMAERVQSMQQANRRLLRDVSHELRSPLARLSVATEMARRKGPGQIAPEIDRIELECQRLEELVADVLNLLKESSESLALQTEEFDLADLLNDLLEAVNYEVADGMPGARWLDERSCRIRADRELLWRTLENLLRNALRYTDPAKGVELSLQQDQNGVEIAVRDHGPGVPEEQVQKIFEPFYRVQEARDRSSGGYGLGLSIAATAVRRHGGQLAARNDPGGGLIVTVGLPASVMRNRS